MDSNKDFIRAQRKDEHIRYFLEQEEWGSNGFSDVILQNNSLPEIDAANISLESQFLGKTIAFPLMINAITGGTSYTGGINRELAELAKQFGLPIAVGSQTIAIHNPEMEDSFKRVRDICSDNVVVANLSAQSKQENVLRAVEMIQADAVQLHLNTPQEMCMNEGDRCFRGVLENITELIQNINVPVIVKETGFGMSFETAVKLKAAGVKYIDISGKGGTNFIEIENRRSFGRDHSFLSDWGVPTALSLLECRRADEELFIVCSGGITKSEEIVKALCMGANLTAMSGAILRILLKQNYGRAAEYLDRIIYEVKLMLLLLGAGSIDELRKTPYLLKGELRELYINKFCEKL